MKKAYLGIDAGTLGCKTAIYDEDGKLLSKAMEKYQPVYPKQGWIELNAELVFEKIEKACKTALDNASGYELSAISVSSQGEAVIPVDENYRALHNAIVTFDNRTSGYVDFWEKSIGRKGIYDITGVPLHGIYTANKILWFRDNLIDVYKKTHKFLCFDSFIIARLGNVISSDPTMSARTMLMDIRTNDWSEKLTGVSGIPRKLLPEINASGKIVGEATHEILKRHSNMKIAIIQGGHDQSCGALGCGVVKDGQSVYSIGTTTCLTPCYNQMRLSDTLLGANLITYPYLIKDMYSTNAYNFSGGILFDWAVQEFFKFDVEYCQKNGLDKYEFIFKALPEEPSKIFVLPYFTISGTPYMENNSMGAILNLSVSDSKWDILRAVLESIVMEIKLNVEILNEKQSPVTELRVTGGATKSGYWMQMVADILNMETAITESRDDTACRGVAMLCHSTTTGEEIKSVAERWTKIQKTFTPNVARADVYQKKIEKYRRIYPNIKNIAL